MLSVPIRQPVIDFIESHVTRGISRGNPDQTSDQ